MSTSDLLPQLTDPVILSIVSVSIFSAFVVWRFRTPALQTLGAMQVNVGSIGSTKRLLPNLAFLCLFFLFLNLTWF